MKTQSYGQTSAVLLQVRLASGTPTPAADSAVLVALRAKGYTLRDVDGFTCMIVPVGEVVDVLEVAPPAGGLR